MFIYICKHCARSFVLEIHHLVTVKLREKIVLTLLSVRLFILSNHEKEHGAVSKLKLPKNISTKQRK